MLIPKYWARESTEEQTPDGRLLEASSWQWSERSLEEARARARQAVERMAQRIRRGEPLPKGYAYGARPPREEILEHVGRGDAPAAVLTRNSYGSVVLNTAGALFVDVDLPQSTAPS